MMAKVVKKIGKISDKLTTVSENFTVYMYDNGYMVEIGGKSSEDDWKTAKILCNTLEEVLALVTEAASMERDS